MKTPTQLFAEKYAGCRGKMDDGRAITVVGWYKIGDINKIAILFDDAVDRYYQDAYIQNETFWLYQDIRKYVALTNPERIILDPEKLEIPDDCLNCGAKGKELCRDNCPNKE